MDVKHRTSFRPGLVALTALLALALSALACGPTTTTPPTAAPAQPTSAPPPTAVPAQPTAAPQPTTEKGGTFIGSTPEAPLPVAGALSPDNVSALTVLIDPQIDASVLPAAATSPISHDVATFGSDGVIRVWDLDTGDEVLELTGHTSSGFALAYSPDGSMIASGGGDYRVRVWDAVSGANLWTEVVNAIPYRITWAPDSTALGVVGQGSSRMGFFDAQTGQELTDLRPSDRVLWAAAFSPDERYIATVDNTGQVTVFNFPGLDVALQDSSSASGAGWDLEFSPDSSLLASCNDGGGVYIWDTSNMTITLSGKAHSGDCVDGVFSIDSRLYFSAGDDGHIIAWDMASGTALADVNVGVRVWTLSVTNDGKYVVAALDDGALAVLGLPGS